MRLAVGMVLLTMGCAARHPAPPLAGPSSAPVMETPARVALIAAPGDADWKALGDEATALLSQYLRINTTNPPGNEIMAARWLADVLRRDGIEAYARPDPLLRHRVRSHPTGHGDLRRGVDAAHAADRVGSGPRPGFVAGHAQIDHVGRHTR